MDAQERKGVICRVTLAGAVVNLLLTAFKLAAGLLGRSQAMVADAVHSLSDLATDIAVLFFARLSSRPRDQYYDYGYGKFETLSTFLISLMLLVVGGGLLWGGACAVYAAVAHGVCPARPHAVALWAALVSIASKEAVFRYTMRWGRRIDSAAVRANAWHHRSDALSSVGAALGIGGAIFLGERWTLLDPVTSVVVSVLVIREGVALIGPSFTELMEKSLSDDTEREIEEIVRRCPAASDLHNLRTRRLGNTVAMEMHVRMDGRLTLEQAHRHTVEIERALRERFGQDTHVALHVEPVKERRGATN